MFRIELIRRRGPWRGLDAVELATLEWVDWYNNRRLFEAIGDVPPARPKPTTTAQIPPSDTWKWRDGVRAEDLGRRGVLLRRSEPDNSLR